MSRFQLRCTECAAFYAEDPALLVCPSCARQQAPGRETRGILEVELAEPPSAWPRTRPTDAAFLHAFLPLDANAPLPPLQVGGAALLPVPELRRSLGMPHLWVLDDTRNPSASTKDRASWLVVAKALEYGFSTIAAASTGNAATALAASASAAGVRAVVFVPNTAPEAKLVQMLAYGAEVVPVDGSYDTAFELCLEACASFGWYNRNTALNPFTVEGKKTAALEIARGLRPEWPDVVLVPTGDGVILSGLAKGFDDLVRGGLLRQRPRFVAVQPTGSPALVNALNRESGRLEPVVGATSIADSLVVETPRGGRLALHRIRESGGAGVLVSDEAILAAIPELARLTGVFAEPAAAAALAGLHTALRNGVIDRHERVVLLITGSGLKDVGAAARAVSRPEPITPSLEAVARRLRLD